MAAPDVTGVIDGPAFRFQCPFCSHRNAWSTEQVMSIPGDAIADECLGMRTGLPRPEAARSTLRARSSIDKKVRS